MTINLKDKSGGIKSIQEVSITIASGATTGDATITAIGDTYRILYNGIRSGVSSIYTLSTLEKINATTIRATRGLATADTVTVLATVEDLY